MVTSIIKAVAVRLLLLFNPVGAILQALEAIYKVLKWVFQNAARIFKLVETVVNGIADIIAGNVAGFAGAVEKGLAMLIPPVIAFIADYFSLGDLPKVVADKIKSMQAWVLGMIERALGWVIDKGKALLAKMGMGKKDEKKKEALPNTVGEVVTFTAAGESHRLWIEARGDNAVVMVASTKEALEGFLNGGRVSEAIQNDKTKELEKCVKAARVLLKATDLNADAVLKELRKIRAENDTMPAQGGQIEQKNDTVKEEEHELADLLIRIFELVGGGLKIVEVIGAQVDSLIEAPEGYEFWTPGLPRTYREIRRKSGYARKGKEYPRVSVDGGGLIKEGVGALRYDIDLVSRYDAAIADANSKQALIGKPDLPKSFLESRWESDKSASDTMLRGYRYQMEAIIAIVNRGSATLIGVEVTLDSGARVDYIVEEGTQQKLVECKAWNKMDLTAGRKAARDFRAQIRRYVDEAQTPGSQAGNGVKVYQVHLNFASIPRDWDEAIALAKHEVKLARRRKPPITVTYEGL